jgi:hypothetical protein
VSNKSGAVARRRLHGTMVLQNKIKIVLEEIVKEKKNQ